LVSGQTPRDGKMRSGRLRGLWIGNGSVSPGGRQTRSTVSSWDRSHPP
jgi:hypothetical protein